MAKSTNKNNDSAANIGFEAKLWLAADKLRNNMHAAEYKHVVVGLIFIKYISDAFQEIRAKLLQSKGDYAAVDPRMPTSTKPKTSSGTQGSAGRSLRVPQPTIDGW